MKNLIKLLLLMVYTFSIFFIFHYYILGLFGLCNVLVMLCARVPAKSALMYIVRLLPFILFASVINVILGDLSEGILIMIRLIIVCNITYSFKYMMSSMDLANAVETLLCPIKAFKADPKDIGLMICIGVAFLPILIRELLQVKSALQAKGMNITFKTIPYIFKPFLYGILKRTDEITNALKSKGYV